jgi:hypothetical protein
MSPYRRRQKRLIKKVIVYGIEVIGLIFVIMGVLFYVVLPIMCPLHNLKMTFLG